MTAATLLWQLGIRDVRPAADGDSLSLDGPDAALTDDLLAEAQACKSELLDLIRRAGPLPGDRCNWPDCDSTRLRIVETHRYGPEWLCGFGHPQGWEPVVVEARKERR